MLTKGLKNYYFSKAQKLITQGDTDEATRILKSIIHFHPKALTELTKLDFVEAKKYNDANLFKNAIDNRNHFNESISEMHSLNVVLKQIQQEIHQRVNVNFEKGNYLKAYEFAYLLLYLNNSNQNNLNRYGEATLAYATSLINTHDINRAKELLSYLFVSASKYTNSINSEVISTIYYLAMVYKNRENGYSQCNDLCKLLFEKDNRSLPLYLDNCVQNINQIELINKEASFFYQQLNQLPENDAKNYYAQIIRKSESAKSEYINYIIHLSNFYANKNELDKSINSLNEGIAMIIDKKLINQKVAIIKMFPENRNNDKINLLKTLIGRHEDAQPLLAQIYLELADVETSLDKKRDWMIKAMDFNTNHNIPFNTELYKRIFPKTLTKLLSLAQGYSQIGYFEDAYDILNLLYVHYSSSEPLSKFCEIKIIEARNCSSYKRKISLLENTVEFAREISKRYLLGDYIAENVLIEILLNAKNQVKGIANRIEIFNILNKAYTFAKNYKNDSADLLKHQNEVKGLIVHFLFEEGKQLERENKNDEVLCIYKFIQEQYGFCFDVEIRICLCQLKIGGRISETDNTRIVSLLKEKSDANTQDLAYRYALYLLKIGNRYKEASKIIEQYLPPHLLIHKYCKMNL